MPNDRPIQVEPTGVGEGGKDADTGSLAADLPKRPRPPVDRLTKRYPMPGDVTVDLFVCVCVLETGSEAHKSRTSRVCRVRYTCITPTRKKRHGVAGALRVLEPSFETELHPPTPNQSVSEKSGKKALVNLQTMVERRYRREATKLQRQGQTQPLTILCTTLKKHAKVRQQRPRNFDKVLHVVDACFGH